MPQRLATIVALLAFALCLIIGGFEVGNPFTTTVERALAAMAGTYAVGLVVGLMGKRAIDENLQPPATVPPTTPAPPQPTRATLKPRPRAGR